MDCKLRANCTKAAQGRRIKRYPEAVKREFALHVMAYNLSRAGALLRALFFYFYAFLYALGATAYVFLDRIPRFLACVLNHNLAPDLM
jgi:hypothetical protein